MKDRDTQYRLAQNRAMACAFDSWIPGGPTCPTPSQPFSYYLDQVISNALDAGHVLEGMRPNHFGKTEKPFFLTEAQGAKVRGDVFEMICRAILWNCCADHNRRLTTAHGVDVDYPLAIVTLGDNYDLRRLFVPEVGSRLESFLAELKRRAVSLSYSTPDLIGVNVGALDVETISAFSTDVATLTVFNQERLAQGRRLLEGRIRPEDVVFACGIKTSLRSDRMYQFLFEANAWKFVWRRVFGAPVCRYHSIMTQTFGADPEKLRSLDFSADGGAPLAERAIDSVTSVTAPEDVVAWFVSVIRQLGANAPLPLIEPG